MERWRPSHLGCEEGEGGLGFCLRNHRAALSELLLPFHSHCLFSLFHTRILIHFISLSFFFATADGCLGVPLPPIPTHTQTHTQAISVSGRVSLNICRGPFQWVSTLLHLNAPLLPSHGRRRGAANEATVVPWTCPCAGGAPLELLLR